ncbi:hypothetical protein K504DRAFT_491548 [Pleomassaria siparia CBS 279.74]|uniref:Uncharacterized protein n=1 Tax=Pleomassaria siparia CBS 279.74 TaxID=1314801 RepID=A0A6G1K965_9PLEO|nr:hypothetical protein K504DRAFT_491548 [Pleomassaria siparia CBS 279.74]
MNTSSFVIRNYSRKKKYEELALQRHIIKVLDVGLSAHCTRSSTTAATQPDVGVTELCRLSFEHEHYSRFREASNWTSTGKLVDKPDRTKHVKWEPRRFTWGGRQFVWKRTYKTLETEQCEIKRECPQPRSKTGKILDECFEPIVYVQTNSTMKKSCVATFRYNCGNHFLFREWVLASCFTYQFVIGFGHD